MTGAQHEARNKNRLLTELRAAWNRGALSGIRGRLGDLGKIDQKYDVAISSACPSLDFLVADTVQDAEQGISFLREKSLGRANFICLEKMVNLEQQRLAPFRAPAGSIRLFEQVTPKDDKYLNAFYFAVRDTLVASDVKAAAEIAFSARTG